ncbi:MAG TPA: GxxExxY protein [Candidatus Didemnitutus sp.]|nr:GxxExxY protein [Candidatus Didemnitutus sp.]
MDTNGHEKGQILHRELVYSIVGCALEVLDSVGHGLHEKPYENALVVEFGLRGISVEQQRRFPINYKGIAIGEYVPDLLAASSVVIDTKVIDRITDHERGQMLNYLKITKFRVGLILNFRHARLEWERLVL